MMIRAAKQSVEQPENFCFKPVSQLEGRRERKRGGRWVRRGRRKSKGEERRGEERGGGAEEGGDQWVLNSPKFFLFPN